MNYEEQSQVVTQQPPKDLFKDKKSYLELCAAMELLPELSHATKVKLFLTSNFVRPYVSRTQVQIIQYMLLELYGDYPLTVTNQDIADKFDIARMTVHRSLDKILTLEILTRKRSSFRRICYEYSKGPRWYAFEEDLFDFTVMIVQYKTELNNGITIPQIKERIISTLDWVRFNQLV